MLRISPLQVSLWTSVFLHGAFLSIMGLTFGKQILPRPESVYTFLGPVRGQPAGQTPSTKAGSPSPDSYLQSVPVRVGLPLSSERLWAFQTAKPAIVLTTHQGLPPTNETPALAEIPAETRNESTVMFYPLLSSNLAVYFKDRRAVHIELLYKVISARKKQLIELRRTISSGNLEADLLAMRYVSRYLFSQPAAAGYTEWKPVRIDLSPRSGEHDND